MTRFACRWRAPTRALVTQLTGLAGVTAALSGCAGIPQTAELDGYMISVRTVDSQPVVTTRQSIKTAEMSAAFARHIPQTWRFAAQNGEVSGQPIAIYHAFDGDSVDVEVGVPVVAAIEGEGEIRAGSLPGGKVLVASHFGSYQELGRAHAAMEAFIARYGVERAGPCWEVYVSDPGAVPADKIRTDVYYPIK